MKCRGDDGEVILTAGARGNIGSGGGGGAVQASYPLNYKSLIEPISVKVFHSKISVQIFFLLVPSPPPLF